MNHTFSIQEAFWFGWEKTKAHSGLLFQTLLILFALQVVQAMVTAVLANQLIGFLATVAIVIAEAVVGIGLTFITLKIAKGQKVSYADIIPPVKTVWHYILATLLAGLMVVVGLILLVVPGIYLALRFSMVRFAVLDGAGVRGSITQSGKLTEGIKWKLLGFLLLCGLLNIVGMILLFVGLLVTIPVSMIAYAHVYQKLHARHHTHAAHPHTA